MTEIRVLAKVFLVSNDKLLLMKRSPTDKRRPGQWDIPGGHTDANEFAEEAAARETLEEANINVEARALTLVTTRTKRLTDDLIAHWLFYAIETTNPESVVMSAEHEDYRWVSYQDALELITYDIQHEALRYAVDNNLLG